MDIDEAHNYRNKGFVMGALMLIISTFCIALCSGLIHLAGDLPSLEKQFVRSVVMITFVSATTLRDKKELVMKKEYAFPTIVRGIVGGLSCSCNFYAIDHLPLATANMCAKIAPFFAVLFAGIFLREKIKRRNILALIFVFAGVALIVKPSGAITEVYPVFVGISSGILGGAAFAALRAANKKGAPNGVTVMSFSIATLVCSLPTMIFGYEPMAMRQFVILILAGLVASVGHTCIARAYRYAPPGKIAVFDYSQVIWSALIGFIMFDQVPALSSCLGFAVIIGTGVFIFIKERSLE